MKTVFSTIAVCLSLALGAEPVLAGGPLSFARASGLAFMGAPFSSQALAARAIASQSRPMPRSRSRSEVGFIVSIHRAVKQFALASNTDPASRDKQPRWVRALAHDWSPVSALASLYIMAVLLTQTVLPHNATMSSIGYFLGLGSFSYAFTLGFEKLARLNPSINSILSLSRLSPVERTLLTLGLRVSGALLLATGTLALLINVETAGNFISAYPFQFELLTGTVVLGSALAFEWILYKSEKINKKKGFKQRDINKIPGVRTLRSAPIDTIFMTALASVIAVTLAVTGYIKRTMLVDQFTDMSLHFSNPGVTGPTLDFQSTVHLIAISTTGFLLAAVGGILAVPTWKRALFRKDLNWPPWFYVTSGVVLLGFSWVAIFFSGMVATKWVTDNSGAMPLFPVALYGVPAVPWVAYVLKARMNSLKRSA